MTGRDKEVQRYQVRWIKDAEGVNAFRTLIETNDIRMAREWRDKWRKCGSCADVWIWDRKIGQVTF